MIKKEINHQYCQITFYSLFRFILCDEEEGLYEDLELSPYDPEADSKKEAIKLQRQQELLQEVDFDKWVYFWWTIMWPVVVIWWFSLFYNANML